MTLQLIILISFCTLGSASLAFLGGIVFEKWWTACALERATRKVNKAFEHLVKSLEATHNVAGKIAGFPGKQLENKQILEITRLQQQLNQSLESLVNIYIPAPGIEIENNPAAKKPVVITPPSWTMYPCDFRSNLPDYSAGMQNLSILAEHVKQQGQGSVLLVQMDRFDDLGKRYGETERNNLFRNLSQLIIRNMREADLLCHMQDDILLLLMPWTSDDQIAIGVRETIKGHRFFLDKTHEEVIVTASLGLYTMSAGDNGQLALERATAALLESRKKGRNQLMHHNGRTTSICKAC